MSTNIQEVEKGIKPDWDDDCQGAFDKIKSYLANPPVLLPPQLEIPLVLYLTTTNSATGAMSAQKVEEEEWATYYLSKNFAEYETRSA